MSLYEPLTTRVRANPALDSSGDAAHAQRAPESTVDGATAQMASNCLCELGYARLNFTGSVRRKQKSALANLASVEPRTGPPKFFAHQISTHKYDISGSLFGGLAVPA